MAEEQDKIILVVDDESHIRRLIEFTLKKGGYKMLAATNGREAVDIATSSNPNLIIMDVLMPEKDGVEALNLLKKDERTSSIPVILLTGIGQSTTKQEVEEKGTATYLAKPFSPNKLLKEVQRMI